VAGCSGGGGGGGDGGETTSASTGDGGGSNASITVQFGADSNFKKVQSEINTILHDNGLADNIKLEVLAGSFTTGDRQTKYKQILNAKQSSPTILMMDNGWTIPFIARDQIANLSKEMPGSLVDKVKNDYFQASVSTATMDGDLYGIPLFADFPTMLYRKDLVREAGYSDSDFSSWQTDSMTWKQFSTVVKDSLEANTDKDYQGYNFQAAAYGGLSCCDFVEWMSSWGGAYFGGFDNLFGPIGDRPITVTEQPVVDSINMVKHFIHGNNPGGKFGDYEGNISPEAVVQYKEESSRKPFQNGNVIFHRNWPYAINAAAPEYGDDLGVMPLPYAVTESESKYDNIGGISSALGGWHLTLNPNASSEKLDAAKQIFQAITQTDAQLRLFELGGWIPPVPDMVASDEAKQLDTIGPYVDSLKVAGENAVPRPVTVVWPQESSQIASEVNASLQGNKQASKAMSDLESSLEQIESSV
jgi:ABC-type glycerol-3-phosphate transport system substrate-binding protein